MGTASKVLSIIGRFFELISAAIVCGIVGTLLHDLTVAHAHADSRIVYAIVIAGISLLFSIVLFPPVKYSFHAFPFDYALFVCWMVEFGLLSDLSGGASCTSTWYWSYWGYYWGGWYYTAPSSTVTQSLVGTAACAEWRAVLAWSFIGGMFWLANGLLGTYVVLTGRYRKVVVAEGSDVTEEKDTVGWHVKVRSLGRKVGYNPGTARSNDVGVNSAAV